MKTIYTYFFLAALVIFSSSCSKSALSDVEIDDPSLVDVEIKISQDEKNYKEVFVRIRDKNMAPIEFKSGKVIINGAIAKYGRASGISSKLQRGYVYEVGSSTENVFSIDIWYNSENHYSFLIDYNSGFDGFVTNQDIRNTSGTTKVYVNGEFQIKNTPFAGSIIPVEYKLLKTAK